MCSMAISARENTAQHIKQEEQIANKTTQWFNEKRNKHESNNIVTDNKGDDDEECVNRGQHPKRLGKIEQDRSLRKEKQYKILP